MKTKALSMMGLGLAVACLCLAPQSPAAKGGIPGAPGGEDPPDPEPTNPIVYQRVDIELQPQQTGYTTASINDYGVVAGTYATSTTEDNSQFTVLLPPDMSIPGTVSYRAEDAIILGINEATAAGYGGLFVNNYNEAAGVYVSWSDVPITNEWWGVYTNWCHRAVFWDHDGTMSYLWSPHEEDLSQSCAINDAGLAVIVDCMDYGDEDFSGDNWWDILSSYVVVPEDSNNDGEVDTWFADDNGDGINDLAYLIDPLGYQPRAINEYGEIVFSEGVVLMPDYDYPDDDGNHWYADADGDGTNDLFLTLTPLEDTGTVSAGDINDLGQIAGSSATDWDDRQAVIWTDVTVLPADLGKPDRQANRVWATDINNSGQVIGSYYNKQDNLNYKHTAGSKPFLFHEGAIYPFRDLTTDGSGWNLQDINDNGWIINGDGTVYIPVEQP